MRAKKIKELRSIVRIRALLYYEFKSYFQDPKAIIPMILAPIFIVFVVWFAIAPLFQEQGHVDPFSLALVNDDQSFETQTLIQQFEKSKEINEVVTFLRMDEEKAKHLLYENEIAAIIMIPKNFSRDMSKGINTPIVVVGNHHRPVQSQLIKAMMESNADLVSAAQSGVNTVYHYLLEANASKKVLKETFRESIIYFTLHSLSRNKIFETEVISALENLSTIEFYGVSSFIIILLFGGLISIHSSMNENDVLLKYRLISYGLKPYELVVTRFIFIFLLVLLQLAVVGFLAIWFLGSTFQGSGIHASITLLIIMSAISALFTFIAVIGKELSAAVLVGWLVIMSMSVMGGSIIPLAYMPNWVASLSYFSINKWATLGLIHSFFGFHQSYVWQSIGALSLLTLFLLYGSILITKQRLR